MGFMQPQVQYDTWLAIDGDGRDWIPLDLTGLNVGNGWFVCDEDGSFPEALAQVKEYIEQRHENVTLISCVDGWGARLSAPGFLDCTPWVVFGSEEDARDYLMDTYGEPDDE